MTPMANPLPEGAVLGILGGGQLGRMTAIAAAELGYKVHIFAPQGDAPACDFAYATTRAEYTDEDALKTFGMAVDAVTSEFENVPASVMDSLAAFAPVSPGRAALEVAQHRIAEKTLAAKIGIAVPRFAAVTNTADLQAAMADMPDGAILKTCRLGYDGKGQARLTAGDDLDAAWQSLGSDDCILEQRIAFSAEASFLVARTSDGHIKHFPASINHHENGILSQSRAPADPSVLSDESLKQGQEMVAALAEALELVGVLAMETFITDHGLIFNEIAPRPHNSFHWTIEGTKTSQFAQLVRAVMGLPLGDTTAMGRWQMDNILGEDMAKLDAALGQEGVFVHRYGKAAAKPGRKMAHLTRKLD